MSTTLWKVVDSEKRYLHRYIQMESHIVYILIAVQYMSTSAVLWMIRDKCHSCVYTAPTSQVCMLCLQRTE